VSQAAEDDAMTTPDSPAAILTRFEGAFAALEQTLKRLDDRQLTEIRDPAGWAAKDHLIHVALWEQALLAKADGRARHEALGVDAATDAKGWEAINAAIFVNTRHRSLPDVLDTLRRTHAETRARLAAAVERAGDAGAASLLADTPDYVEHYDQHRGWIEELVGR
jgi:hypothetical protein